MSIQKVDKTTGDTSLLCGSTNFSDNPIGAILPYGGATAPSGWFLCQGQAISRTTYAELFAVIGTAFGTGDGSTTFNLPDMREAVPKGAGLTGHTVGAHLDADGLAVGEFLDDRVQTHQHSITLAGASSHIGNSSSDGTYQNYKTGGATPASELRANNIEVGRSGDTTEVKSVGVNYIIKAKMVALPADLEAQVEEAVEEAMTDTGWVTINSYVKARRIGKTVSLELIFSTSAISAGTWTKIADLETRFRPSKQVIGCAYTYVSGGQTQFDNYYINASGAVNLLGNADLTASVTYLVD